MLFELRKLPQLRERNFSVFAALIELRMQQTFSILDLIYSFFFSLLKTGNFTSRAVSYVKMKYAYRFMLKVSRTTSHACGEVTYFRNEKWALTSASRAERSYRIPQDLTTSYTPHI